MRFGPNVMVGYASLLCSIFSSVPPFLLLDSDKLAGGPSNALFDVIFWLFEAFDISECMLQMYFRIT